MLLTVFSKDGFACSLRGFRSRSSKIETITLRARSLASQLVIAALGDRTFLSCTTFVGISIVKRYTCRLFRASACMLAPQSFSGKQAFLRLQVKRSCENKGLLRSTESRKQVYSGPGQEMEKHQRHSAGLSSVLTCSSDLRNGGDRSLASYTRSLQDRGQATFDESRGQAVQ